MESQTTDYKNYYKKLTTDEIAEHLGYLRYSIRGFKKFSPYGGNTKTSFKSLKKLDDPNEFENIWDEYYSREICMACKENHKIRSGCAFCNKCYYSMVNGCNDGF